MRSLCVVAGLRLVSRKGTNCPVRLSRPPIRVVGFFVDIKSSAGPVHRNPPTGFTYLGFGLS